VSWAKWSLGLGNTFRLILADIFRSRDIVCGDRGVHVG
jgi:hypothetical protein